MHGRAMTLGAALSFTACASAPEAKPSAELDLVTFDVEKSPATLDESRLTFPWKLDNPTGANATVAKIDWRLEVEGETPRTGQQVVNQEAPANGSTEGRLELPLNFDTTAAGFSA